MPKQIISGVIAREAIKKGVDQLANAVKITLGPRGRNVVLDKGFGAPVITNDGVTIAKEITLINSGTNPMVLKRGMDKAVVKVSEILKKNSKPVTKEKIKDVAVISANDEDMGSLIAEVISKVGKEGVVTVEEAQTLGVGYELVEGLQFDRGYVSPYMVTDTERMEAGLEKPYILITDKKISALAEIMPLLEKVVKSGSKNLVIIADEIEGEALATLVVNKLRGVFNVLAVKAPGFGDRRKELLEDIVAVVNGDVISEDKGMKLENVELNSLGEAKRVVASKDNTTIVGGGGAKSEIERRIKQIKISANAAEFGDEAKGINLVLNALESPMRVIARNSNKDDNEVIQMVSAKEKVEAELTEEEYQSILA